MALVRAILRSDLKDLTISLRRRGPGAALRGGQGRKAVYAFASLDTIPLEPHPDSRQNATIEAVEYDEGMFVTGLRAAATRLPFLPTRAGLAPT